MSVIELAAHPGVKPHQRKPQPFRKTTKQERMQKYYKHLQTKYSGRTTLEAPNKPKPRPASALSLGNAEENDAGLMHMMNLTTPRAPTQRIGNFHYPIRTWQKPQSSSGHTSTTTMYTDLPEASAAPKYHGKFSGNSLPKWNQLYRAYHGSSNT